MGFLLRPSFVIFFMTIVSLTLASSDSQRSRKNTQIIFKKLTPIEINENIPIGFLIIDLKANLDQQQQVQQQANDELYYTFEFVSEFGNERLDLVSSSQQHHHYLFNSIKSYFLLDSYTGIIYTSRSIDLENFCDLNLCHNRLVSVEDYGSKGSRKAKNCLIQFRIKATRHFYANKTVNLTEKSPNGNYLKDAIYHISFDLVIHDQNEFKPEFGQRADEENPLVFNVSEEFAPIKLPLGSIAYDNDCDDRGGLFYAVKVSKVNQKSVDDFIKDIKPNFIKQFNIMTGADNNSYMSNIFDFQIKIDQTLLFLSTNKSLDRELVQSIELDVIASDRDIRSRVSQEEAQTAVQKVLINVADMNDNAPRFDTQVYNLEFDEGLAPNTELLKLNAHDPDLGPNGDVRYEFAILNDEIRDTFLIHPVSGSLMLKKKLDYGKKKYWQLSIRASDQSPNPKSSIALVNLKVNDINNNKPDIGLNFFLISNFVEPKLITRKVYDKDLVVKEEVLYLSKNIPKDTVIALVVISDKDSDWNGYIDSCELNLINQKGPIPLYLQEYVANSSKAKNRPSYSPDANLNNEIDMILKTDFKQMGSESKDRRFYFLRTAVHFDKIFQAKNMTQATAKNYLIEISATDKGQAIRLTGKRDFMLSVLNTKGRLDEDYILDEQSDVNEAKSSEYQTDNEEDDDDYDEDGSNSFVSARSIYKVEILENNRYPIELIKINATDLDMTGSAVKYELLLPSSFIKEYNTMRFLDSDVNFTTPTDRVSKERERLVKCSVELFNARQVQIDRYNGIISLNASLDRETCPSFKYLIKATDLVEHRLNALLTFKIEVNDVNDNGPTFEQKNYVFHIMENTVVNTSIIPIRIVDPDLSTVLFFRLESRTSHQETQLVNSLFGINTELLLDHSLISLTIKKPLDYEIRRWYTFSLSVSDTASFVANRTDTTLVEVHVLQGDPIEHEEPNANFRSKFNLMVAPFSPRAVNLTRLDYELFLAESSLAYLNTLTTKQNYLEFTRIDLDPLVVDQQQTSFSLAKIEFYEYSKSGKSHDLLEEIGLSGESDASSLFKIYPRSSSTSSVLAVNSLNLQKLLQRIKPRSKFLVSLVTIKVSSATRSDEDMPVHGQIEPNQLVSTNLTFIFVFYDQLSKEDSMKLQELKYYLADKLLPSLISNKKNLTSNNVNNYYKRIGLVNAFDNKNYFDSFSERGYFRSISNLFSGKTSHLPVLVICFGMLFFLLFIVLIFFSVLKWVRSKRLESIASPSSSASNSSHSSSSSKDVIVCENVNLLIKTTELNDSKRDSSLETHSNLSSNSTNTTSNTSSASERSQQIQLCNYQPTVANRAKPKKKIKFNFNHEPVKYDSNMVEDDENDQIFVDDDLIIPMRGNNYAAYRDVNNSGTLPSNSFRYPDDMYRQDYYPEYLPTSHRSNTLNGSTYKKSQSQPEENIWIRKYNNSGPNSGGGNYHSYMPAPLYQHHVSFVNPEPNRSLVFGPNDREVVL